jgi:hypothetical protein
MSRMNQINLEIQEMLQDGFHPVKISKVLGVPLGWVYDTLEAMQDSDEPVENYVSD